MTAAIELVSPPVEVVLRDPDGTGCRVYAAARLAEGETIERAPVVVITADEVSRLDGTALGAFAVPWGPGGAGAVALGYGAVYRGVAEPNARQVFRLEQRMLEITAVSPIDSGDEITVSRDPAARSIPAASGTTIVPPSGVRFAETEDAGRAVFAARRFHAGETIEQTPCITFPQEEWKPIERTILDEYGFLWGEDLEAGALPLGYGAVYNHSFEPNACYVRRLEAGVMDFVAIRDIGSGDEIRTNYNRDPLDLSPVWFDVAPYGRV